MNDERKKVSQDVAKQAPLDDTEAEGIVGGTGTGTNTTSTDEATGPDESTWDGGFTRPD